MSIEDIKKDSDIQFELYDTAKNLVKNGMNVIPISFMKKEPVIKWKEFQERLISKDEIERYFNEEQNNIAIVCGEISENLVVIDFDNGTVFDEFIKKYSGHEFLQTPIVKSAKGGHIWFRCKDVKSTKLYYNGEKVGDIISEGKYVLVPPSVHPDNIKYSWVQSLSDFGIKELKDFSELEVLGLSAKPAEQLAVKTDGKQASLELPQIKELLEELKQAQEGERNILLNKVAFQIGSKIGDNELLQKNITRNC